MIVIAILLGILLTACSGDTGKSRSDQGSKGTTVTDTGKKNNKGTETSGQTAVTAGSSEMTDSGETGQGSDVPLPTSAPTPTPYADMRPGTYDPNSMMLFDTDVRGGILVGNYVPCYALSCDEIGFDDISFAANSDVPVDKLRDGYTVYRFILKKGLAFDDGADITIDDALYSLGTVCSGTYSGLSTVPSAGIYGMRAYSMQMTDYRYDLYNAAIKAGISKDGTIPETPGYSEDELREVWSCLDDAGELFAQNIIDYIVNNYKETTWVHTFMSSMLSYSDVMANESLKTAYAFIMWGYGAEYSPYSYWSHIFKDKNGTAYNLDEVELTAKDLWKVIFKYYGFDLSDTGINYEKPETSTERIEDLLWKVYYDKYSTKISTIPGILKGTVTGEDGIVRSCIYVIVKKDSDIAKFNFAIWDRRGVG